MIEPLDEPFTSGTSVSVFWTAAVTEIWPLYAQKGSEKKRVA